MRPPSVGTDTATPPSRESSASRTAYTIGQTEQRRAARRRLVGARYVPDRRARQSVRARPDVRLGLGLYARGQATSVERAMCSCSVLRATPDAVDAALSE